MEPNPRFTTAASDDSDKAEAGASPSLTDQWSKYFAQSEEQKASGLGVMLDLPSGNQVRARRPHLLVLMNEGRIPDALTPLVTQIINLIQGGMVEGAFKAVMKEYADDEAKAYTRFSELLDVTWINSVIEPVFVKNPLIQKGFAVSGVPIDDKMFLFTWCQGVSQDIATFRAGQKRLAEAASTGKNVFDVAIDLTRTASAKR